MAAEPPGRALTFAALPDPVVDVLAAIADAGHEVALVGGSVRDRLLGHEQADNWDAATSARPDEVASLFPEATWENRFGTVTIGRGPAVEVTSYRAEGPYRDHRRPDEVRFGVSLADDLSRRDFTINAMAWVPRHLPSGFGTLVDPFDGEGDLRARVLRTVGNPRERFREDALRLIRAARFAGRLELTIDAAARAAITELAPMVATVSAERVRDELLRILTLDARPSRAIRLLEDLGLLVVILPELAALRGIPQNKAVTGDALDHTLAAVDAVPAEAGADLRLAALVHDIGKASTLEGGHFIGHEKVGAELAARLFDRLRVPRVLAARVVGAVRHHMYAYDPSWTDAAVRRFIRRTADLDRELLFGLRAADNAASGVGRIGEENQAELEARIARELDDNRELLVHRRLAVDGHDLQRELGMSPGPEVGAVLDRLAEAVLDDPSLNDRTTLLRMAAQR